MSKRWFRKLLGILKIRLLGEVFEPKLSMFSKNYFPLPQSTYFVIKLKNIILCYELNLELQFSKTFAESNFETASCGSFLRVELLNCMLLKPLGDT